MKTALLNAADRHFGWIVKSYCTVVYGLIGGMVILINVGSAYGIH